MKRVIKIFFILLAFCLPLFCYLFLDQLYARRFVDFSNKWLVRETPHLMNNSENLSDVLEPYDDVLNIADDLIGFGIIKDGIVSKKFGQDSLAYFVEKPNVSDVSIQRIGFLKFRSIVRIESLEHTYVFFTFLDDMAYINFLILMLATVFCAAIALFARSRFAQIKEETMQDTTILSIKSMAHDFRAPFGKLRIFMNQLKTIDLQAFHQLKNMNEELDAAVEHADDVLMDFLSLDAKPELSAIDCESLVARLEKKYFSTWQRDNPLIDLQFYCEEGVCFLGNEKKTLRVLFNLLDNALKHAKSAVNLEVKKLNGLAKFSVKNDGPEIPKSQLKSIFKPFYSKRKGGVGLGLFISQSFVESQGGKIKCESSASGTIFQFTLPLSSVNTVQKNVQTKPSMKSKFKIAYVDDEKFYLDALTALVRDSDIILETFKHTDEILMDLRAGARDYDLILVDRYGPSFDAVLDRFCESCRDFGYKGPIVLYSNSVIDQGQAAGFARILDKTIPLTLEKIRNLIEESQNETL